MSARLGWTVLLCAASAVACRPVDTMPVEEVLLTYLSRPDLRSTQREAPGRPPRVDTLAPRDGMATARPCLVVPPPGEVLLRVPAGLPDGAFLRVDCGADREEWRTPDRAQVAFEIAVDGEVLGAARCWPRSRKFDPDQELRDWQRFEIPLAGVREVRLATAVDGPGKPPAAVGFGGCEVLVRETRERAAASPETPSLLVVCIDTLRADRLGCYGGGRRTSPTMDALARRGRRYDDAFASSPWTWPSTASLLTGLSPPEHGLVDHTSSYLAPELATLAEVLQGAGATTAAFSTNPLVTDARGFGQGFETFVLKDWAKARVIVPSAEAWLATNAERRFFLYLHLTDPHLPYEPDPDLRERFAGESAVEYDSRVEMEFSGQLARRGQGEPVDEVWIQDVLALRKRLYDAEIAGVDRQLRSLFRLLGSLGRLDDTLIVVTSDHGEEFLEHGLLGHGKQLWDESVRVPLLIAGPGIAAGEVVRGPVENRHLAATLCELLDLAPPPAMRGAGLDTPSGTAAEPLFLSVRRGRWVDAETGEVQPVPVIHGVQVDGRRLMWAPAHEKRGLPERRLLVDASGAPLAEEDGATGSLGADALVRRIERWLAEGRAAQPEPVTGGAATLELLRGIGYVE